MKQTQRSLVGLLVLAVVGIALAFGAAWVGRDEEKKAEDKEKSEQLFAGLESSQVRSLRITKDGQLVVAAQREPAASTDGGVAAAGGWKLTEPVSADADATAVNGVVDALLRLKQKKDLGDEKDAKQFGLDKPQLAVAVKVEGGKELGVEFGLVNSFDNTLYARKTGDPTIRVLDASQKQPFDKSAFDLRDKRVAMLDDAADVTRVEVTGTKTPYVLEKSGANWKVSGQAADTSAADGVVRALKNLRATAIASESAPLPAQFGLDLPKAVVTISAAGQSRVITFGQPGPGQGSTTVKTYARRADSPVIFQVDNQILKDIDLTPEALQDKTLTKFDREAVRKLVLESPGSRVEIARSKPAAADGGIAEEKFTLVAPTAGPAKTWKVSGALYTLAALKAASFAGPAPAQDLAKYGLDQPKTVIVLGDGDKVLARVRFGADHSGQRYALADGVDKLALVERTLVDDLPWAAKDAQEDAAPPATPQAAK